MRTKLIKEVLLVEDNPGDERLLREMFNEQGSNVAELTTVTCMLDAEKHLSDRVVDVVLLDLGLPDAYGIAAVSRAHAAAPSVPLVVLTGFEDEALAAQALQEGAQDYLIKGQIETRGLFRALRYAVERKIMEEALFAEKERAQVTLNCIGDAVACSDVDGNISFLNVVAESMTGWPLDEAIGRSITEVVRILDAGSRVAVAITSDSMLPSADAAGGRARQPSHWSLMRRDAFEVPIEASVASIRNREGEATGSVIVFRDVSTARNMALELAHQAGHDFLTGLPNRVLLNDRISRAIALAKRRAHKVAALFLDVDGFKHINDSLGHAVGDRLLQAISARLTKCLRGSDSVSRLGDEFVVVLSEVAHAEDAAIAARRILGAVAAAYAIEPHELHVTTSIGVSVYPDDGEEAETLLKCADTAMYQAKDQGRNRYQFFKPAMNVRAVERQFLEEGLRRALDRQELALQYQPKIDLQSGEITGAEALLRWTHPSRGAISPAQFIPVAEDCGLILGIGNWALREACRQTRAWKQAGLSLASIAVNISAIELRTEGFPEGVLTILDETGLDPRTLELELTESVLMKHVEHTQAALKRLRASRVRLAVDDFGTGYSSLSYLRKLSIDTLKIDQSFVRQITSDPDQTAIVAAVIGIGKSLKLRVVAEGVETIAELAFLRAHQCDEAQGYYFSRPIDPEPFARLLATGLSKALLHTFEAAPQPASLS